MKNRFILLIDKRKDLGVALIQYPLIFTELIDFLASIPTSEEIMAYEPSKELQERLHYLLEKNLYEELSPQEKNEMNEFVRLSRFVGMLKIRVWKRLIERYE